MPYDASSAPRSAGTGVRADGAREIVYTRRQWYDIARRDCEQSGHDWVTVTPWRDSTRVICARCGDHRDVDR